MSVKHRVEKLERFTANGKEHFTHISYFIIGNNEPIGYEANGLILLREPGEHLADFRKRCSCLVKPEFSQFNSAMPLDSPRLVFTPIFSS